MGKISEISEDAVNKGKKAAEAADEAQSDTQDLYQMIMRLISVLEAVNEDVNSSDDVDVSTLREIHSELGSAEEIEQKIENIQLRLKEDLEFLERDFKEYIKPELLELEEDLSEAENTEYT